MPKENPTNRSATDPATEMDEPNSLQAGAKNGVEEKNQVHDGDDPFFCPECEARRAALDSKWGIASAIRERYQRLQEDRSLRGILRAHQPRQLGALFVDFENIYLAFRDMVAKPLEMTIHVLTRLRDNLQEEQAVNMVMGRAYASWEYGASRDALSHLSLLGIVPQYVLSRPQKSSADLKLSIDLMEVLLTRDDIACFVIAGGDRDYMPIVEKIKERAKSIYIVSPGPATSGDLIALVGEDYFIDATAMLPSDAQPPTTPQHYRGVPIPVDGNGHGLPLATTPQERAAAASSQTAEAAIKPETPPGAGNEAVVPESAESDGLPDANAQSVAAHGAESDDALNASAAAPTSPQPESPDADPDGQDGGEDGPPVTINVDPEDEMKAEQTLRQHMHEFAIQDLWRCVGLILRAQGEIRNREIWVGPFLKNYMNEAFDFMNNMQRKRLLAIMEEIDAIQVHEKLDRMGEQTYSVMMVNWQSPVIKAGLIRQKNS
jgi:uncharacterized LabA/DUF88 family protein